MTRFRNSDTRYRSIRMLLVLLALVAMTAEIHPQVLMPECRKVTPVLVLRDANSPSISADGKQIAVSPRIGLDEVYDLVSGRRLQTFRVPNSFGSQLSADGRELAIFAPSVPNDSSSRPCKVLFFDVDSGRETRRSTSCVHRVLGATRFNKRSENLETVVWDTQSGRVLLRLPFASRHLALSDDGRRVATTREPPLAIENNSVSLAVNSQGQVTADSSADVNPARPPQLERGGKSLECD